MNILAVDVDYRRDKAVAAGIVFQDWNAASAWQELTVRCQAVEAYVPGEFYRRELPCILKLLEQVEFPVDIIVIDGFVYLVKNIVPAWGVICTKASTDR